MSIKIMLTYELHEGIIILLRLNLIFSIEGHGAVARQGDYEES